MIEPNLQKIKQEGAELKKEVREKTLGYILTAFGLVAGLAWNEAIKGLIDYFFPAQGCGLWAKFVYAVIITLVVVVMSFYLARVFKKSTSVNE